MNDHRIILTVDRLVAAFDTESGRVRAVEEVSLALKAGSILGLVGESGCGKSVTALSIMRLLPRPAGVIESGAIHMNGQDLVRLPADQMQRIRGRRIAMIFQEPMTALNPVQRIGRQLLEVFEMHRPELDADGRLAAARGHAGRAIRVHREYRPGLTPPLRFRGPAPGQAARARSAAGAPHKRRRPDAPRAE